MNNKLHVNHIINSLDDYQKSYDYSIDNTEEFWAKEAEILQWSKPFTQIKDVSWQKDDLHIRWFEDGELNVCVNCVDRHLEHYADKTAIIWEGDDTTNSRHISFKQLHREVCRLANGLIKLGVESGDRVIIYMPMIPELAFAMLACARIGAIHSVVFGGFSAIALSDRIDDCEAKVIITADEAIRGNRVIGLKNIVDEALSICIKNTIGNVLMVDYRKPENSTIDSSRDVIYSEFIAVQSDVHQAQSFPAEHPLFILYTSGSTGKPKGLQHSSAGYLTYTACTFRYLFDLYEDDVYWCSADLGWVAGHSYILYGPLANGTTTIMFEGVPTYPNVGRFGEVIDKYQVTLFYTAPTAIRSLIAEESSALASSKRSSLRLLGTVGEPINPEVWQWYNDKFGLGQCEIVDTWWQTETGAAMMSPFPYPMQRKPGSTMTPFLGIKPALIDADGNILEGAIDGNLVILDSWPGMARTIWGNHKRFYEAYFSTYNNMYFTGDGSRRDEDGDYWITGRVDDVLNVSGHRLGTAEIESALVSHPAVAEAAIVGYPHSIKGEAIYVYVISAENTVVSDELTQSVIRRVREVLGPVATPDLLQWCDNLPKTRSGKIMRRILRKIAANDFESLGDISTLAEADVVQEIIDGRLNK